MDAPVTLDIGACHQNGNVGQTVAVKIPDRLLKREQERLEAVERRKEAKESQAVTEEKSDFFTCSFNAEKAAIEEMLSGCSELDRDKAVHVLETVTSKIQTLQKFLNDSVVFLTQYELRQAQAAVQRLQCTLAEMRDQALPKKKFTFRSRPTVTTKSDVTQVSSTSGSQCSKMENDSHDARGSGHTAINGYTGGEQCGFSNVDSKILTKGEEEIRQRDVLLTHLSNCKVRLLGCPSTLHIKHVRNSQILCGPVSSSVFVDQVSGCNLAFPCQQLRTHNTTDTDVYLHVTSRAIIEDCSRVRFAPFSWSYPGMDTDFEVSGLDRDRNNWSLIDDFNWLAADTPSPNWTLIPEAERRSNWD
ncbi:tubulin-specific chaperone C-like [Megalops cyprinoides]|uniref:tubulin-specific chaperone C-like n=1 Tax=Megalops cyprinoides TaxID=118141 RepID=UPI0018655890|nr:tubulin-specific chaperone C-like [Megalops cyprinoides]